jgi:hypothetical protein
MNIKRGSIFFLAIALLFVSSCQGGSQGSSINPTVLKFEFLEDYPQEELSEEEEFQVGLKIYNDLAEKVNFNLCVKGDRPEFYGGVPITSDCVSDFIEGAYEGSGGTIIPSEKMIYFPSETSTYSYHNLDEGIGDVNVYAELNYPVESLSSMEVCILDNINLEEEIGCTAEESIGKAAVQQKSFPLVVSKIEKDIKRIAGKNKIDLKIYLDKSTEGEIVRQGESQFDLIDIEVSLSGTNAQFVCKKREGRIVFIEREPIECVADLIFNRTSIAYRDTLNIDMRYSYKSVKYKKIVLNVDNWEHQ